MGGHVFVELSKGVEHTELDGKDFGAVVSAGAKHVADLTWKELALYNWGTAEPAEVNRILSETIGCETIDEKDPSKTKLAVKKGPKTTVAPRLPKLWTQGDLAPNKTHTIKVKKRVAAPAVAITELAAWFLPGAACALKYRLEGIEGRADKLDFEVHAHGYFAENKGGSPEPSDTTAEAGSTHIFQKLLTPDLKKRDAQEWSGWKGESQATKGVLASTGPYKHASHHCAPYTVLLRYRKSDTDKAKLVLGPFAPAWKPAAAEPTDESLVVTWTLSGDDGRKLTRGLLLVVDKDGKEVFRAGLDRTALEGGKYDLAKDARNAWPKASVKKAELPYRVQLLAHSESDVEEGLALAAMHTLVRACNYTQVQLIGCNIRPGYTDTTPKKYLGEDDADKDIKKRAEVMIEAIQLAAKDVKVKKDDASVLKVFMAPEFYWRGTAGAYPAEKLDSIVDVMRPEVTKPEYADWLFVYGTAIGYLPHETVNDTGAQTGLEKRYERVGHPPTVTHDVTISKVTTTNVTKVEVDSKHIGEVVGGAKGWKLTNTAGTAEEEVTAARHVSGTTYELTLKGSTVFSNGAAKVVELRSLVLNVTPGAKTKLEVRSHLCRRGAIRLEDPWLVKQGSSFDRIESLTRVSPDVCELTLEGNQAFAKGPIEFVYFPALVKTVASTKLLVHSRLCGRIPQVTDEGKGKVCWSVEQFGATAKVTKSTHKGGSDYELELGSVVGTFKALAPLKLVEPLATEVLNVAFVQKGWPSPVAPGLLRQAVVYKENVSHIDYLPPDKSVAGFYDKGGMGRRVTLHGDRKRLILPTDGAHDILGASPNSTTSTYTDSGGKEYVIGSEVNHTGAGGGGVITIDGVTFGVEVCRDHLVSRLKKFYARAKSGDPKVQVLLVPSWGAWLQSESIECVPNAPMLNVDGGRSDSVLRVHDGGWSCEQTHPEVIKTAAGRCGAELTYFKCSACNKHVGRTKFSARCTTHGQASLVEYRHCASPRELWGCPSCGDVADTPGTHCVVREMLRVCDYEKPYYYCTQCKNGVKSTACTTHPTSVLDFRACDTCGKYYPLGEDCDDDHDDPEGRCTAIYLASGGSCSSGHTTPQACGEFYKLSDAQCSKGHSARKTCREWLKPVGKYQSPDTLEIDVPGSDLKTYFETKGHVTVYAPLAIPPAKVV